MQQRAPRLGLKLGATAARKKPPLPTELNNKVTKPDIFGNFVWFSDVQGVKNIPLEYLGICAQANKGKKVPPFHVHQPIIW